MITEERQPSTADQKEEKSVLVFTDIGKKQLVDFFSVLIQIDRREKVTDIWKK